MRVIPVVIAALLVACRSPEGGPVPDGAPSTSVASVVAPASPASPASDSPEGSVASHHLVRPAWFDAIAAEYSGERAQETLRRLVEYHRIQGSPMMAAVAERVVLAALKADHIESSLEQFPSDGAKTYASYVSPMGWDMRGGELWVDPAPGSSDPPLRLCRYADVPMCVATYSKGGEWSGELFDVGRGTKPGDYEGKDVRGKVALAYGYAGAVVREAVVHRGALGAVIYPNATDRPSHPDMIRYNGIWPTASELATTRAAFMISANQYASLKKRMKAGPVTVRGRVDAVLEPYKLTLVHAYVRGREEPDQEVLVTAHLDHPKWSANDNASGSAAMLEVARSLSAAITAGKLPPPRRTLHFMWVPEFYGTVAYVVSHPEVRRCGAWDDPRPAPAKTKCIVADINMDMVGEDPSKTDSHFYFTRAPDSVPSFLTTLLTDVLAQTHEASLFATTGTRHHWQPQIAPYEQGSDHDVFLGLGVPSTMLGHEPDWTHHTSEDTPDKTDASELLRVGVFASAAVQWLGAADAPEWKELSTLAEADRVAENARRAARQSVFTPQLGTPAALPAGFGIPGEPSPAHPATTGPRRSTVLPIDEDALEDLPAEDRGWWESQSKKFPEDRGDAPGLGLLVYETMSFMDSARSVADIAHLLSSEFFMPIDAAWVERVVTILAKKGFVAR